MAEEEMPQLIQVLVAVVPAAERLREEPAVLAVLEL
jgi:hypothetical protein